jgi:hypothetical protein
MKSAVEKLADRLSGLSFMLAEEGKFSKEVDDLLDTYEYSGMEGDVLEDSKIKKDFIGNSEEVLERHKKGTLSIRPYKNPLTQKELIDIKYRKKNGMRRPFSRKSGDKLQSVYTVKSNIGANAENMLTDIYRKKKSSKSKSGRKVVKKTKGCGCK